MNLALDLPAPLSVRRRRARDRGARAASTRSTGARFNRYLLAVHFEAASGEVWSAVGGRETVVEAVAAARESLPLAVDWSVAGWNDLYGD